MRRLIAIAAALLVAALATLQTAPDASARVKFKSKWITLFDGKNLDQWEPNDGATFKIEDGSIVATDKKDPKAIAVNLVSKQSFKDFDLRAEFWVSDDANSGIYIRCTDPQKVSSKSAYEVNVFDQRPDPTYGTGAIVNVAKAEKQVKAGGKWNNFHIVAKGSKFVVTLNGVKTVRGADDKKFPEGRIALQFGQGTIKFRKVVIKPL